MLATSAYAYVCISFVMSSACPQLGFEVHMTPKPEVDDWTRVGLHDAFVACVEDRALSRSGRSDGAEWAYVVWREGSQADDLDREAIRRWAAERPEFASARVGLLFDVKGENE